MKINGYLQIINHSFKIGSDYLLPLRTSFSQVTYDFYYIAASAFSRFFFATWGRAFLLRGLTCRLNLNQLFSRGSLVIGPDPSA